MKRKFLWLMLITLLAAGGGLETNGQRRRASRPKPEPFKICPDPSVPCRTTVTFQPHDLPFRVRQDAVIWESEQFYAVVLKSMRVVAGGDECSQFLPESERLEAQSMFPRRKVFASRCAEPGEIYYTNVAADQRFMAVYAGLTRAEAERTLALVKATGKFPGANLRRMRAGFNGT